MFVSAERQGRQQHQKYSIKAAATAMCSWQEQLQPGQRQQQLQLRAHDRSSCGHGRSSSSGGSSQGSSNSHELMAGATAARAEAAAATTAAATAWRRLLRDAF